MPDASLVAAHPDLEPHLRPGESSQRARLLEGMVQAVAEKGFAAATVADAVRAARVSRGTFYALFASKEECFLEAYRHGVDVLVERVRAAARAEHGGWEARLRAGLAAYLDTLSREPVFARTYMLEIHAAGARAQAERDRAIARFAQRYRSSFAAALDERPQLPMPSDDALFVLAAGVDQLISMRLREDGPAALPALADTLLSTVTALLLGGGDPSDHDRGGSRWT